MLKKIISETNTESNPKSEVVSKILVIDDYGPTTEIIYDIFKDILPKVTILSANNEMEAKRIFTNNTDIGIILIENDFGEKYRIKGTDLVDWMFSQRKNIIIVANSAIMSDNEQLMQHGCLFHSGTDKNPEQFLKIALKQGLVFTGLNE